jgi:hypothetical protein
LRFDLLADYIGQAPDIADFTENKRFHLNEITATGRPSHFYLAGGAKAGYFNNRAGNLAPHKP